MRREKPTLQEIQVQDDYSEPMIIALNAELAKNNR